MGTVCGRCRTRGESLGALGEPGNAGPRAKSPKGQSIWRVGGAPPGPPGVCSGYPRLGLEGPGSDKDPRTGCRSTRDRELRKGRFQ